jgi:hypothetical protein
MDYQNGKIYRIVCNKTGLQYVGSTTQPLCKRLSYHKKDYKKWLNKQKAFVTSYKIIENSDYDIVLIENYKCDTKEELHKRERYYIETLECVNKNIPTRTKKEYREANKEQITEKYKIFYEENKEKICNQKLKYYTENKEKLNKQNREYRAANRDTVIEKRRAYNDANKEKIQKQRKEYIEANKEALKNYRKEYREANKAKISSSQKLYNEVNKDKIKEKRKEYREANKDKFKLKTTCECGRIYLYCSKARHLRSEKHIKFIEEKK